MRRTSFNAHGELVCPEGRFVLEPTPFIPGQCLYGEIGHIVAPGAPIGEKVKVGRTLSARGIRKHYDEYHDYHHETINAFKADPEQKRVDAEALAARVEGMDPHSPCGEEDFGGRHVAEFFGVAIELGSTMVIIDVDTTTATVFYPDSSQPPRVLALEDANCRKNDFVLVRHGNHVTRMVHRGKGK